MARAIVYTEFGGPEVLHAIDIPDPARPRATWRSTWRPPG